MASIKIVSKQNGVAIVLPTSKTFFGDPDGDYVAEAGAISTQISIKRSIDDFYIIKNIDYTYIRDSAGVQIGTSRDNCVSVLNSNYLNRTSKLNEIDDVAYQNPSLVKGQVLQLVDIGGGVLRWSNEIIPQYNHINGCFFDNLVRDVYLPIQGGENEYTTLQRWNKWVAPYDCTVTELQFRREYTAATTGTVQFGVFSVNTGSTVTLIDSATITPDYASGTTNSITVDAAVSKGDTIAFLLRNQLDVAMGNLMFSITIKL